MDGENNGKPYQNGWFGGTPIFGNIHISNMKCGSKVKSSKTYLFPPLQIEFCKAEDVQKMCKEIPKKKEIWQFVWPHLWPPFVTEKKKCPILLQLSNNRNVERSRTLQSPALKRCEIRTDDLKRSKYYVFSPSYKTRPSKLEMWNLSPIFSALSFDLSSIFSWKIARFNSSHPASEEPW